MLATVLSCGGSTTSVKKSIHRFKNVLKNRNLDLKLLRIIWAAIEPRFEPRFEPK